MNQTLKLQARSVYGNTLAYPICGDALILARLANKKTFNESDLGLIKSLGYRIEWIAQPSPFGGV